MPGRAASYAELERVFSPNHEYHERIFYDAGEGSYYDRARDLYISLEEVAKFCRPVAQTCRMRGEKSG